VGLNSLKSLNLTNGYPNNKKNNKNNKNNNKVKSKPLELFVLAGKNWKILRQKLTSRKYDINYKVLECASFFLGGKKCPDS
jgi:hypothetical protein